MPLQIRLIDGSSFRDHRPTNQKLKVGLQISQLEHRAVKSILLHVQDDESLDSRLQTALSLARVSDGHLSCLHVTPIEAYVAFDTFSGVFVMQDIMESLDQHKADLRTRVENQLQKEDVRWDYQQTTGSVLNKIVSSAALADVVVTGREFHKQTHAMLPPSLLGDLLYRSRTPLVIPASNGVIGDPFGPVLIGWDGSYEAANAVRSAVGLLSLSSRVEISVVEEEPLKLFPATRLLEYLSRHEIHADLHVESAEEFPIPNVLVARAEAIKASYLVMGGYSRSRIGEYFFGGVTRRLLQDSPVALFIAR